MIYITIILAWLLINTWITIAVVAKEEHRMEPCDCWIFAICSVFSYPLVFYSALIKRWLRKGNDGK